MAFTVTLKNKYYYSQRDLKLSDQKVWSNARVTANSIHISCITLGRNRTLAAIVRGDRALSIQLCHPALQNRDKVHAKRQNEAHHYLTE